MMSSPAKAVGAPWLTVPSGALPAERWLCPVDTPEVAPKMKAMTTHFFDRSTWTVTAYNPPFLFTFFRACCGLPNGSEIISRGMETRHLTNCHEANLLHRLDIQAQEKDIRFFLEFSPPS
jgi:hypothetical protein